MGTLDPTLPRDKRCSVWRSAAWRAQPLLSRLLGEERRLRLLLNVERAAWRLAYEAAGRRFGDDFHNRTGALPPELLREWVPSGSRVIDVGCGKGRLARLLSSHAAEVVGIDYYQPHIEIARSTPHAANLRFEFGNALELNDGVEHFDVALLIHVLEHIDDAVELLRDLRSVAPVLIVEVPAFDMDVLNYVRRDLKLDFSSDQDHVREYTHELLAEQLRAAGWIADGWARSSTSHAALAHSVAL